jgi:hypothetical protein
MKQRPDAAHRDKREERIGFIVFFPINILLAFLITPLVGQRNPALGQLLPWLVNGGFVALTYIIRPHMSLGFLAGAFWLIAASVALGVIFVGSCLLSLVFLVIPTVGPILAIMAWLVMLVYGLYRGVPYVWGRFGRWWTLPPSEYNEEGFLIRRTASDHDTLVDYHRGDLEIGDDGELRERRRSRRDH